ncbi:MAG: phosphoribosylglycinamide formyltransferase [Flavobacteriaceae bacterium]|nr:phosphoribosylglycinamide formyltransferase [Flavobacteriaceae bacterium]
MNKRIILFASGNGSNVEEICRFFEQDATVTISAVFSNKASAGVIKRVSQFGLEALVFDKTSFTNGTLLKKVEKIKPNLIILAGFLWKIGEDWVKAFPEKIVNIHPAILPKYGGKGMYGSHVHKAVKANGERETGITIHFVNEAYDEGATIFQAKVSISNQDTVDEIAAKVHQLEHRHFPLVIKQLLKTTAK